MNVETWFVLSVAAAFLLLGIAGSPLAWVAFQHRKSRLENLLERRWNKLAAEMRRLEGRLALAEQPANPPRQSKTSFPPRTARTGELIRIDRSSRAGVESRRRTSNLKRMTPP